MRLMDCLEARETANMLLVRDKRSEDKRVKPMKISLLSNASRIIERIMAIIMSKLDPDNSYHSLSLLGTKGLLKYVNNIDPDIINFHWTGGSFVSIAQLNKIIRKYSCVWTLHDSYPLTYPYHYKSMDPIIGLSNRCRSALLSKVINLYRNVMRLNISKISFVAPSSWMKTNYMLSSPAVCTVIPNPVPKLIFNMSKEIEAYKATSSNTSFYSLLIVASSLGTEHRKGIDLSLAVYKLIAAQVCCRLVIVGYNKRIEIS